MDFALTEEQQAIQALAREFAEQEIAPHAADWDREHRFPREVFAKLAELGLTLGDDVDIRISLEAAVPPPPKPAEPAPPAAPEKK